MNESMSDTGVCRRATPGLLKIVLKPCTHMSIDNHIGQASTYLDHLFDMMFSHEMSTCENKISVYPQDYSNFVRNTRYAIYKY